jgi:hypothetical protein
MRRSRLNPGAAPSLVGLGPFIESIPLVEFMSCLALHWKDNANTTATLLRGIDLDHAIMVSGHLLRR